MHNRMRGFTMISAHVFYVARYQAWPELTVHYDSHKSCTNDIAS
ncbi:hypothetical protein CGRA01v4_11381 [Colletotrichum graminicola]|nr:hypothetical protein CGRA01v4_11381 [Colletotrichum graminicola]